MSTSMTTAMAGAKPAGRDPARDRALVRGWLFLVALMIIAMVVVGGATRLTHSGLSITEWKPIHGVIPPLNDGEWQEEFAKYQQIPEYRVLNQGMSLGEFKGIFWWEWSHRLLGRAIGFAVLLPLVFFWFTGRIERALVPKVVAMLVLGGLQGAIGWWMVASGLAVRTDVSQYRLATHLTFACLILAYVVWVAAGLLPSRLADVAPAALRRAGGLLVALVFLQIFLGGLVAGLDAGLSFNTWPLMDGHIVPGGLLLQQPVWRNFFESVVTVQFDHRMVAYLVLIVAVLHAAQASRTAHARRAAMLAGLVVLQACLGILTLIQVVPLPLALLHQLGAAIVLSMAVAHLRLMRPAMPLPAPSR